MYFIINMHLRCFLKEQKNFKMHFSSAANNGIFFLQHPVYKPTCILCFEYIFSRADMDTILVFIF